MAGTAGASFAAMLESTVAGYRAAVADARDDLALLLERMAAGDKLDARTTFPGHVTTSAVIVDPAFTATLLVHHLATGRWFQPGGHYEGDARFVDSARREGVEETGSPGLVLHPWHGPDAPGLDPLPIDIDTHFIPARPAKGEPDHWHFDMRFVFVLAREAVLEAQPDEIAGLAWRPVSELAVICPRVFHRLAADTPARG